MNRTALIAIDWGTSSARAYRVGADGTIEQERSAALGVAHVRAGAFPEALSTLLGEWEILDVPRLASGMIGSRQGWVEAPYLSCPADFAGLGEAIVQTPGGELSIVPGVTTRDAAGVPDVMRGEETQLAGSVKRGEEHVLAVLPGTHSKWARVERARLVDFLTYLTGEFFAVLMEHSILGRLPERTTGAAGSARIAFDKGVARGLAPGDLAHDVFGARTLALAGELGSSEVAEWLSGLLIGREIRSALTWASEAGYDARRVRVIGSDVLVDRYVRALEHAGLEPERGRPDAAAHGLFAIAQRAGLLSRLAPTYNA